MNARIVDLQQSLKFYNTHGNRIVVFRAVDVPTPNRVVKAISAPRLEQPLAEKDPNVRPVVTAPSKPLAGNENTPFKHATLALPIAVDQVDPSRHMPGASSSSRNAFPMGQASQHDLRSLPLLDAEKLHGPSTVPNHHDPHHHTLARLDSSRRNQALANQTEQHMAIAQITRAGSSTPEPSLIKREASSCESISSTSADSAVDGQEQRTFQPTNLFQNAAPAILEKAVESSVELLSAL